MKKYINHLLMFSLVLVLGFGPLPPQTVNAASTNCTGVAGGPIYDVVTGTPCSLVVAPTGIINTYSRADLTVFNSFGTLKKGAKGQKVATLQDALNLLGFSLDADGVYGAKTQAAIKEFQKKYGLRNDGVAGAKTIGTLINSLNKLPISLLKKIRGVKDGTDWLDDRFPDFVKDIDFKKSEEWGTAVQFDENGAGTKYIRDFGPDPKNPGKRLEVVIFVERPQSK